MFLLVTFQLLAGTRQDWHVGDIATQDVRTPAAMDLIDADATAMSKAAAEIVQLMQRLNEVRAPLQERLAAYEQQIQELEKKLGRQSKENLELLRLQIALLKQQFQAERTASRMDFN